MKIILWGDMTINEGQFLQQVASQKPAIAAIQFQMSEYQGKNINSKNKITL